MKKLIISIVLVLAAKFLLAQANTESSTHLTFKGIPIDGTLSEYILKLENIGFSQIVTKNEITLLKGDFASYKNCTVGVATLEQKDLVCAITVFFPECDTWSSLSSNYFLLKEMLTEKYGKPSNNVEKFDGLQPRDDNSKIFEVKLDRCKYSTTYITEKGSIQLSIEHNGLISCFVQLTYFDKINGDILKAKAIDDL